MKEKIYRLYLWIANKRILDGYIGIFGIILWYRILAKYHGTIEIFSLSMRVWKWMIFDITVHHWPINRNNASWTTYPPMTFRLKIFTYGFDTGAEAARTTKEKVDKYLEERKKEKDDPKI